jgi:hypothetical protein
MRKYKSLFALPVLSLFLIICSCSGMKSPWQEDPLAYVLDFQSRSTSLPAGFLNDHQTINRLISSRPGTGYYLAELFSTSGMDYEEEFFLKAALVSETDARYFVLSSVRLIALLMEEERTADAEHELRTLLNCYFMIPGSPLQLHLLDLLCMLYEKRGERFFLPTAFSPAEGENFAELDLLHREIDFLFTTTIGSEPGEYALFHIIRDSIEEKEEIPPQYWSYYFTRLEPGPRHGELLSLYHEHPDRDGSLHPSWSYPETILYRAMAQYGGRQYIKAALSLLSIQDNLEDSIQKNLISMETIDSISNIFSYSGRLSKGGAFLSEVASLSENSSQNGRELSDFALFEAGRLYRSAGRYWEAKRIFSLLFGRINAIPASGDLVEENVSANTSSAYNEFKKRVLWYLLSTTLVLNPVEAALESIRYFDSIDDGGYYKDFFEKLCAYLVQEGHYGSIAGILKTIGENPDRIPSFLNIRSQYAYVLARGITSGLYHSSIEVPEVDSLLRIAAEGESVGYYPILAASLLGIDPSENYPTPGQAEIGEAYGSRVQMDTFIDTYVAGYFDYGMAGKALELSTRYRAVLAPAVLRMASDIAGSTGNDVEAMRLEDYADADDFTGLEKLFPRLFTNEIADAAGKFGVSVPFLYGLVREESYFQAEVVSYAGAVGLTQLMPVTAEEVAWKMKIDTYDLNNPLDNLTMGAFYLDHLRGRFDTGAKALLAYNAGATNVRRWEDRYSHLPGDLFLEAVPFPESRIYVRRVLVSAAAYGYLYEDSNSAEIVGIFYPNLFQEEEQS